MKMADVSLNHDFLAFAYEKSSPIVEKLDKIIHLIVESGLPTVWVSRRHNKYAITFILTLPLTMEIFLL